MKGRPTKEEEQEMQRRDQEQAEQTRVYSVAAQLRDHEGNEGLYTVCVLAESHEEALGYALNNVWPVGLEYELIDYNTAYMDEDDLEYLMERRGWSKEDKSICASCGTKDQFWENNGTAVCKECGVVRD